MDRERATSDYLKIMSLLSVVILVFTNKIVEMKTSFLDYYKLILEKVSFDENLLQKEYQKALNRINEYEQRELENWIQSNKLSGNAQLRTQSLRVNNE